MAARSTIVTSIRRFLATPTDDPAYSDTILNPIVQEAVDSLLTDINEQNPSYNSTTVTLAADSSTGRVYTFASQSTPITDFGRWLDIRWTDSDGLVLTEVRYDELRPAGADHFIITGIDSAPTLETSPDSEAGKAIWLRYTQWFADMSDDNDVPSGIPLKFHDVIALEALFAFALGGEQRLPPELRNRWFDRRNQLIHHIGRRGSQVARTRLYSDSYWR
ncbi:hypothetical protein LCGC14_1074780 [marine sediment metagenome]|uniref:Uncharacterized protein n=1 Tax=marine sediment metagenome TaxID=412755 RepID=A0A0F9Q041_9ZZZZ